MSLIITGSNLLIMFFFLIAINGFFCFKKMPILGIPIAGISIIFLIGFNIDFNGMNIILTLILLICSLISLFLNFEDYKK